ncbi:hypothetical protein Tco_0806260 [Tanacetum coccineum]
MLTDPSPTHTSEVPVEPQTDPSTRPSPSTTILDSIPESSGGNLRGHSSSDKSLSGNEGEMTLQSVYDLCLSLCAQVSDQAKEIQHLKAQIKKLKKQAKPVVKHHRAWMKSVSLKQRLARKRSSKKQWVHRESVSKQGRKFAKDEPLVHKDPLFDEIPEDTLDNMETKDTQDVGRTRDVVDEEKENDQDVLSIEDVLSTAQQKVSIDKEKVSIDRPIVSTDGSKVSTDRQKDSTDEQNEGTDEQNEGTDDKIEGTDEQSKGTDDHTEEGSATQTTQPPTSTIFRDDETIAQVLLNMSQAKAVSREKEKAEEEATNDALIRNYDDIKARIEADRLLAEKLQEEEREQFTVEERAKFLHTRRLGDEDKEEDYEKLDKKYPNIEMETEYLGTKPRVDKAKHLEEINQNMVIRSNGQKRYFSTLMRVLSIFDRDDLNIVYQLVMDRYQMIYPEGLDRYYWEI